MNSSILIIVNDFENFTKKILPAGRFTGKTLTEELNESSISSYGFKYDLTELDFSVICESDDT